MMGPQAYWNYDDAIAILQYGRYRKADRWKLNRRPVARNTWLVWDAEAAEPAIVYYRTTIVRYHRDGTRSINSGNWPTQSTFKRLWWFTGVRIHRARNRFWFTEHPIGRTPIKTVKCHECHGAWANPTKRIVMQLDNQRECYRCNATGYETQGGHTIYEEWDGSERLCP